MIKVLTKPKIADVYCPFCIKQFRHDKKNMLCVDCGKGLVPISETPVKCDNCGRLHVTKYKDYEEALCKYVFGLRKKKS